jgi:cell division protein FtsX
MNSTRLSLALALIASALLVGATEALAHVCDTTIGDAWRPEHGPVWLLNPVGWPVEAMVLLIGLLLAAKGPRWLGFGVAALIISLAAATVVLQLLPQPEIYRRELSEGCRSVVTGWADVGLMMLFAIATGWLAYRKYRVAVHRKAMREESKAFDG